MRSVIATDLQSTANLQASRVVGVLIGNLALLFGDARVLALAKKGFYGHLQVVILILLAIEE